MSGLEELLGGVGGVRGSSLLGKVASMRDQDKDGSGMEDLTPMGTGAGSERWSSAGAGGVLSKLTGMLRRK